MIKKVKQLLNELLDEIEKGSGFRLGTGTS